MLDGYLVIERLVGEAACPPKQLPSPARTPSRSQWKCTLCLAMIRLSGSLRHRGTNGIPTARREVVAGPDVGDLLVQLAAGQRDNEQLKLECQKLQEELQAFRALQQAQQTDAVRPAQSRLPPAAGTAAQNLLCWLVWCYREARTGPEQSD